MAARRALASAVATRARRSAAAATALVVAAAAMASCDGMRADAGADAAMQVEGAQFVRGAAPGGTDGPAVGSVGLVTNTLRVGGVGKVVDGTLAPGATAAALMLEGDRGYWLVPAGVPGVEAPGYPSFAATLAFSRDVAVGPHPLVVRAVDGRGAFGPPSSQTLEAIAAAVPDGPLVVSLTWDTEADLDLHVVDATGAEIFNRDINSWKPTPGKASAPDAWKAGGILDVDSNAGCAIDGLRRENVAWQRTPPPGHYVVRVDTASMCGQDVARWSVIVIAGGVVVARAAGTALPSDTRFAHDRGAGVLAVEFDR